MDRFLIEVPHEAEEAACVRAVKVLLESGSHYLTNAEFGCTDGVHKGWIIVTADSKTEARDTLHPAYRAQATVTRLNKFSMEELDQLIAHHQPKARPAP